MITVPGPAGPLEALLDRPAGPPRAAVVFAHPHPEYGGTMHTKVVFRASKALAGLGCLVLRFNFRGVGASAGEFDDGDGEAADFRAALDYVEARAPGVPLWAAGMSFGSWIAMEAGAVDDRVRLLLGVATPVARYDYTATRASAKPKFLIHGEADQLCPLKAVWRFYGELKEPKELAIIDAANHLFEGRVMEVAEAVEDLLGDYAGGD